MKVLTADNISFTYKGQNTPVFTDVFFELEKGRLAVISGPSGSGKSTLAGCLCGIIPALIPGEFSGEVRADGRVGIVFQDPDSQIFFSDTEDELAFAPENLCLDREEIGRRIDEVLDRLSMENLRNENPARLSGGQKQLVALAAVLTMEPDILILDEAFSQLDDNSKARAREVLLQLKEKGTSIVMVSHDQGDMANADLVLYLENGRLF